MAERHSVTWDLNVVSWWFGFICFEEPSFLDEAIHSELLFCPGVSPPFPPHEHSLCVACPVTTSSTSRNYTNATLLKRRVGSLDLARRMVWLIFPGDNLNATLLTVSPNHVNFSRTLRGLRGRTNMLPNFSLRWICLLIPIYNNFLHI